MVNKYLIAIRMFLAQASVAAVLLMFLFYETISDVSENNPDGILTSVAYLGIITVRALTVFVPSMLLTSALVGYSGRRILAFLFGLIVLNAVLIFSIEYVAIIEKDFSGVLQRICFYSLSWCFVYFLSLFIVGHEGRRVGFMSAK